MLSPWGSSNYRPSAPFLQEVASHVKTVMSAIIIIVTNRARTDDGLPPSHALLCAPGAAVRRRRTCCGSWTRCSRSSATSTGPRRCLLSTSTTGWSWWRRTWSRPPQRGQFSISDDRHIQCLCHCKLGVNAANRRNPSIYAKFAALRRFVIPARRLTARMWTY